MNAGREDDADAAVDAVEVTKDWLDGALGAADTDAMGNVEPPVEDDNKGIVHITAGGVGPRLQLGVSVVGGPK